MRRTSIRTRIGRRVGRWRSSIASRVGPEHIVGMGIRPWRIHPERVLGERVVCKRIRTERCIEPAIGRARIHRDAGIPCVRTRVLRHPDIQKEAAARESHKEQKRSTRETHDAA